MKYRPFFLLSLACFVTLFTIACNVDSGIPEDSDYHTDKTDSYGIPPTDPPLPDVRIDTLETAFDAVNHLDLRIRWRGVNFIRDNPENPFENLQRLLQNPHDDVVCAAINGLRLTGSPEDVLPILLETIEYPVLTIKTESIINLGELGPIAETAIPAIRNAMKTGDPRLLSKAEVALSRIAGE